MPTNQDRRAILRDWKSAVRRALALPFNRRPKAETIIAEICEKHGVSRRTLYNWQARFRQN